MSMPKVELRCPFCHAVLAPHVTECHRCRAKRHTRKAGMSPWRFRLFVATWLAFAVPLMLAACFVGFAPWAPTGMTPPYALALIGAKPSAEDLVRCRVEVVQADGRKSVELSEGACGAASRSAALPRAAGESQPTPTQHRMATALHTALCLLVGLVTSLGLIPLLRLAFVRKSQPSWVRRAAA